MKGWTGDVLYTLQKIVGMLGGDLLHIIGPTFLCRKMKGKYVVRDFFVTFPLKKT